MDKILDEIIVFLTHNDDIGEDDAEVIRYGLEMLLLKVIFSAAALAVGAFMNSFWECFAFIVFFSFLRPYSGGYHADTRIQCFVMSMSMFAGVLAVLKVYTYVIPQLVTMAIIFAVSLWLFSPIDTENRRLSADECRIFRIKTRIFLCIEAIIAIAAYLLDFGSISCSVMTAIIAAGLLMTVGYIKDDINSRNDVNF